MHVIDALRIPEVARRLDIPGVEVYGLIERGELAAGKGPDGLVYVRPEVVEEYLRGQASSTSA